jgi:MraZ protein
VADEEKNTQRDAVDEPNAPAPQQPTDAGRALEEALEEAFFGSYAHAIDGKGRIIIPSDYRETLGKQFTIGPTRDMKAIALYPRRVWLGLLGELTEFKRLHGSKPKVQLFLNQIFKLSYPGAESDNQGRLLLPAKLRQRMLGEVRDVEISGALDHIRVVDAQKAALEDRYFMDNDAEIQEYLGSLEG